MDKLPPNMVIISADFMKLKLPKSLILTGFMAFSAIAQESKPDAKPPQPPPKEKLSYALGMNLGLQIKNASIDADVDVVAQAIKDVLAGMPTEVKESEVHSVIQQGESSG